MTSQDPSAIDESGAKRTAWADVIPKVFDVVTSLSDCDVAILRAEAGDASTLVLEEYRLGRNTSQGTVFAIPYKKSLRFWDGNAFSTCFKQGYPHGSFAALSKDEQAGIEADYQLFLENVHWRGSFPLAVGKGEMRLVILVAFNEQEPSWLNHESMCFSWVASQVVAAQAASDADAESYSGTFVNACNHLTALGSVQSREEQLSVLLRVLCSGRGLGWQRAWLMRRDGDSLVCESCAGGLTFADWGYAATYARSNLTDLADEIAHDIVQRPRLQDSLFRSCVNSLRVDANVVVTESKLFDRGRDRSHGDVLFECPTEVETNERAEWQRDLVERANSFATGFDEDERLFSCPFRIQNDDYVAVFGWSSRRTREVPPKLIETGAILALSTILTGADSETAVEPPSVVEVDDRIDRYCAMMSWIGAHPLSREELEKAMMRRVRMEFQESETYRAEVRERMLKTRQERQVPSRNRE